MPVACAARMCPPQLDFEVPEHLRGNCEYDSSVLSAAQVPLDTIVMIYSPSYFLFPLLLIGYRFMAQIANAAACGFAAERHLSAQESAVRPPLKNGQGRRCHSPFISPCAKGPVLMPPLSLLIFLLARCSENAVVTVRTRANV